MMTRSQSLEQRRQDIFNAITEANNRYVLLQRDLWASIYRLERMHPTPAAVAMHQKQLQFAARTAEELSNAQNSLTRLQINTKDKARDRVSYDKIREELHVIRNAAEHYQFMIDSYIRWIENQDVLAPKGLEQEAEH